MQCSTKAVDASIGYAVSKIKPCVEEKTIVIELDESQPFLFMN
jgi:hypothetical protein